MTASGLYLGAVAHTRTRPKRHRLRYRLFMMCLDLDEIDAVARRCRWFSRGRFNLFGFCDRDHGDGSDRPLREQVDSRLRQAGIELDGGRVQIVCLPRMLGYVFNPISLYYCRDAQGILRAMIYEVNNTFGERHSYLIPVTDACDPVRQSCAKRLHVSPFMDMDMSYGFRVSRPAAAINFSIVGRDAAGPLIAAVFSGTHRPITDRALISTFFAYPLLTLGVVAGIHWEALKLFLKGIGVRRHRPAPIFHAVTVVAPHEAEPVR